MFDRVESSGTPPQELHVELSPLDAGGQGEDLEGIPVQSPERARSLGSTRGSARRVVQDRELSKGAAGVIGVYELLLPPSHSKHLHFPLLQQVQDIPEISLSDDVLPRGGDSFTCLEGGYDALLLVNVKVAQEWRLAHYRQESFTDFERLLVGRDVLQQLLQIGWVQTLPGDGHGSLLAPDLLCAPPLVLVLVVIGVLFLTPLRAGSVW